MYSDVMSTTLVNLNTLEGMPSYSEKSYYNYEIFKMLFGGSPSEWAAKLAPAAKQGRNWERILEISKKSGQSVDYVAGINLADECINFQSGASLRQHLQNWGCTSVAVDHIIGQTLDLFTVELCIVKDGDATFVTMPPYLCLLGMGKHLAMCTNHLFNRVNFDGIPVSHMRRTILDLTSIEEVISYLSGIKRTTSVNFIVSDGTRSVDIEVTPKHVKIITPRLLSETKLLAHTNHVLPVPFDEDKNCLRLSTATQSLLQNTGSTQAERAQLALTAKDVVQPIDEAAQFGTIITVWMDPKERILAYKDPGQETFIKLKV
jgi:hypothetical protein